MNEAVTYLGVIAAAIGVIYWTVAIAASVRTGRALVRVADEPMGARDIAGGAPPRVSIVIAARDEAATIAASIDAFEHLRWPDLEIVMVNDRSTDGTGAIIDAAAALDPRIRPVHLTELPPKWLGKVHALDQGVRAATGEWLLFTDADVELAPDAIELAVATTRANDLDHLALLPAVDAPSIRVAGAVAVFSRWLVIAGRLWRAADPASPHAFGVGAFNFIRRATLVEAGGLEWLRMDIADDAAIGAMVAQAGRRSMLASGVGVARVHWQTSIRSMARGFEKYGSTGGIGPHWLAFTMATTAMIGETAPLVAMVCGLVGAGGLATIAVGVGVAVEVAAIAVAAALAGRAGAPWRGALALPISAPIVWWMQVRASILEIRRGGLVWRDTFYATEDLRAGKRYRLP